MPYAVSASWASAVSADQKPPPSGAFFCVEMSQAARCERQSRLVWPCAKRPPAVRLIRRARRHAARERLSGGGQMAAARAANSVDSASGAGCAPIPACARTSS